MCSEATIVKHPESVPLEGYQLLKTKQLLATDVAAAGVEIFASSYYA